MPNNTKLPVLRAVPSFLTSDNQTFTSRKDATIHEMGLEIRKILMDQGFTGDQLLKSVCMTIAKKHHLFANTFEKTRRAHRMANA